MRRLWMAGLVLPLLLGSVPALAGPPAATAETANALYQKHAWAEAAAAYESLVRSAPKNGQAWYRLGSARYQLKQYRQAEAAWKKADRHGFYPFLVRYNLAAVSALMGHKARALVWLKKAVAAGFTDLSTLESDPDLRSLRGDERFAALVLEVKRKKRPCHYDPHHRQFDFWLGDWDVFNRQGARVGHSHVASLIGECALLENWVDSQGNVGKSLNYYDPGDGHWKQVWVSDKGGNTVYSGQIAGGAMHFQGPTAKPDGSHVPTRMTFTPLPDGRVRQYIETSTDGGKTWTAGFDGYYRRVSGAVGARPAGAGRPAGAASAD